jgi:carbonic anhydrase
MRSLEHLFEKNRDWADRMGKSDPAFFPNLSRVQSPEYLWIGCADSRVPASAIVGLDPGELLVHRNVANMVLHTDLNCLSVIQFAVDVARVSHILVVGHYGCGGIEAALERKRLGLIDNWLRHIHDVCGKHSRRIETLRQDLRLNRLCELNVIEQVANVCRSTIVIDAWNRGQKLSVHGWIYGLHDGLVRDLRITIGATDQAAAAYQRALEALST